MGEAISLLKNGAATQPRAAKTVAAWASTASFGCG